MIAVIVICRRVCFPINKFSILALALLLVLPDSAQADLQVQTDSLQGPAWRIENLHLHYNSQSLLLEAGRLSILTGEAPFILERIRWECPQPSFKAGLHCPQAELSALFAGKPLHGRLALVSQTAGQKLTIETQPLAWGNDQFSLQFRSENQNWSLDADIQKVQLSDLIRIVPQATGLFQSFEAQLEGILELNGDSNGLEQMRWRLRPRAFSFGSEDDLYAGENLAGTFNGQWHHDGQWQSELALKQGQLLFDPLFWDFDLSSPISLHAKGSYKASAVKLDEIVLEQPEVSRVRGQAQLDFSASHPLREAWLTLARSPLKALAEPYIKPFLTGSALSELTLSGDIGGSVTLEQGSLQGLELEFDGVDLSLPDERFSLQGLQGQWLLGHEGESRLAWRTGKIAGLALGAAEIVLMSRDGHLILQEPTRLPLLDGAIVLEHASGGYLLGEGESVWRLSGRLEPISMPALSTAQGWPELAGQLSGQIPSIIYEKDQLQVAGTLLVEIFAGTLSIDQLRLVQPFGDTPELFADVQINQLDLELLTRTFDFGKIEGRLNGRILDLHLQDWQPVAFDARFFSPEDDTSKRRISQRAVEAISTLGGGGATVALSRGFLGLFEEFRYRRLGIGCRLERGICRMAGIGPAPGTDGGFYLVEGSGLPRIDVIGYNRIVDWRDLLARLQAAAQSEGPLVR